MQLTAKKQNRYFWLLQILGWSILNSSVFILAFAFSNTYLFYSFIAYTVAGIGVTSLHRYYLKKNINLSIFKKKSIIKLSIAILVFTLVYFGVVILVELIYESIWDRTEEEIAFIMEKSNYLLGIINSFISILGWTLLYYTIKFLLRNSANKVETMELNTALKEAQLNTLKGQVNPHFMFNSLNNIRGLMLEDVDKSREMITKLSEMLQYTLLKNDVDAISLEEELEMVDNYIALSKIQMEDRLTFEKSVEEETLSFQIPPMIIQLLVENAAKHGIANLKNGGSIRLKIYKEDKVLNIQVTNTGKLTIDENSTQLGLKNIRQRLRLLYGNRGTFSLEEVSNEVVANIKIPLT